MKIKKQKLLNFLLHAPEEIDLLELIKFLQYKSNEEVKLVISDFQFELEKSHD
jgi:hypothetical protein